MTDLRTLFSLEEWKLLQFSALWVFQTVAVADGKIDEGEVRALGRELSEAHLYHNALASQTLQTLSDDFGAIYKLFKADERGARAGLAAVADLVEERVGLDEARSFKLALLLLGRNIARAEGGGFLGLGERTSEQEKAALVVIASALRTM
ncbi:MAG TPA: hypothetical protein PKG95_05675 [Anaerolineaceae bacterium]|nr:hypothetical protein [Anaerolineaceae bacterium]